MAVLSSILIQGLECIEPREHNVVCCSPLEDLAQIALLIGGIRDGSSIGTGAVGRPPSLGNPNGLVTREGHNIAILLNECTEGLIDVVTAPETVKIDVDNVACCNYLVVLGLNEGFVLDCGGDRDIRDGGLELIDIIDDLGGRETVPREYLRPNYSKVDDASFREIDEAIEFSLRFSATTVHPGTGHCSHAKAFGISNSLEAVVTCKRSNSRG